MHHNTEEYILHLAPFPVLTNRLFYHIYLSALTSRGFTPEGEDGSVAKCLERAFGSLRLFCLANGLHISGIRGFTTANMHGAKNAYPWVGCKGSDSVVMLKWLRFFVALVLQQDGWSRADRKVLSWVISGAKDGLAFSQGIHGHGIWLAQSCVAFLRKTLQSFGASYALLANYCLNCGYNLYGMVPKLHAHLHFRADFDDSLAGEWQHTLNPAVFDNSMSEEFIGKVARLSRRISFKNIERTILHHYQVKVKFEIDKFKKRRWQWKWLRSRQLSRDGLDGIVYIKLLESGSCRGTSVEQHHWTHGFPSSINLSAALFTI